MIHVCKHTFLNFKQYTFFPPCVSKKKNWKWLFKYTYQTHLKLSLKVRPTIYVDAQTSTDNHITFLRLKKKKKTETIKTRDWVYIFKKIVQRLWAPLQVRTPTALFPKISLSLSLSLYTHKKQISRLSYKLN